MRRENMICNNESRQVLARRWICRSILVCSVLALASYNRTCGAEDDSERGDGRGDVAEARKTCSSPNLSAGEAVPEGVVSIMMIDCDEFVERGGVGVVAKSIRSEDQADNATTGWIGGREVVGGREYPRTTNYVGREGSAECVKVTQYLIGTIEDSKGGVLVVCKSHVPVELGATGAIDLVEIRVDGKAVDIKGDYVMRPGIHGDYVMRPGIHAVTVRLKDVNQEG